MSSPSVSSTTAFRRSRSSSLRTSSKPASVASKKAVPPSAIRRSMVGCSWSRGPPIGISGCRRSLKMVSPMRSLGETSARKVRRPSLARSRRPESFMEPEMSSTSSTLAGLRSSRQVRRMRSSTRGSGRPSTRSGCLGSAPFSGVTSPAGFAFRSAGRKPNRPAVSASISSARNSWKLARAALSCGRVVVLVDHDERVVGVEGALGRIERHQLGLAPTVAVEVEQGDLLHRHGGGVAGPVLAQLVGDEQGGVAVVDDRALDLAHLCACLRGGHVLLGEALPLAGGRVVLGHHGRQPGGREVGVGVHELELAELRPADVRRSPAASPPAR